MYLGLMKGFKWIISENKINLLVVPPRGAVSSCNSASQANVDSWKDMETVASIHRCWCVSCFVKSVDLITSHKFPQVG